MVKAHCTTNSKLVASLSPESHPRVHRPVLNRCNPTDNILPLYQSKLPPLHPPNSSVLFLLVPFQRILSPFSHPKTSSTPVLFAYDNDIFRPWLDIYRKGCQYESCPEGEIAVNLTMRSSRFAFGLFAVLEFVSLFF